MFPVLTKTIQNIQETINFIFVIVDQSKLKVLADGKINMIQKLKFVLGRVENIVGKWENSGYQHFLLFWQCFQNDLLLRLLKVGTVFKG